jgi:hypothetical protein
MPARAFEPGQGKTGLKIEIFNIKFALYQNNKFEIPPHESLKINLA